MLSFASQDAFEEALDAIALMSDNEARQIIEPFAFESMYFAAEKITDRLEEMPFEDVVAGLSSEEREYMQVSDNGIIAPIQSIRSIALLLNKNGCVLIGDQMHYFSDQESVLVVGKRIDLLARALKTKSGSIEDKVFYAAQDQDLTESIRAVNSQILQCPNATNFEVYSQSGAKKGRLRLRRFTFFSNFAISNGVQTARANVRVIATWDNYKRRRLWNWVKEWKVSKIRVLPNFSALGVNNSVVNFISEGLQCCTSKY